MIGGGEQRLVDTQTQGDLWPNQECTVQQIPLMMSWSEARPLKIADRGDRTGEIQGW